MTARDNAVVGLDGLVDRLRAVWSAETSADAARWTPDNPAWGQCAVTALVVQDILGGDLLRSRVDGISHYWNRLPDGSELDLTREQFESGVFEELAALRDRAYVLSFPETARRYERLSQQLRFRGPSSR